MTGGMAKYWIIPMVGDKEPPRVGHLTGLLQSLHFLCSYVLILKLPALEKSRERGDLIAVYRASKGLEKVDRDYLFVWDDRTTRGHEKKLKRTTCKREIKNTASHIET